MSIRRGSFAVAGLALAFLASSAQAAGEPGQQQCASAYENAQLLRHRGSLVAARDAALTCARPTCPAVARHDCATWATEIAAEVPTVVVVAREEGTDDDRGVKVTVDGTARAEAASGRAFDLDPGDHAFKVERPGDQPIEQTVSVVQGEHDRIVRFTLHPTTPSPGAPPAVTPVPRPISPAPRNAPFEPLSPAPQVRTVYYAPAIVVASASAVILGVSAYLGVTGRSDLSHLRETCAPTCSDDQVNPVREKLTISDVTLGVGVAGQLVALYLFLRPPTSTRTTASGLDVIPGPRGASVAWHGVF
ncbi:MAG TPA: hypothetical protein VGI39_43370 [Polyangiaceae bacterium]